MQWTPPTSYPNQATLSATNTPYRYQSTVTGSVVMPDTSTVYVRLTGEIVNPLHRVSDPRDCRQPYGGGPSGFTADSTTCPHFWSGTQVSGAIQGLEAVDASTFVSANVPTTSATNGDKIGLVGSSNGGAPTQTLEFFSDAAMTTPTSASNLVMLVYSLGGVTRTAEWSFTEDFTILSHNRGATMNSITGNGFQQYTSGNTTVLSAREGSGAIQFTGNFNQFSWTVEQAEIWASWQLGVTSAPPPNGFRDLTCAVPVLATGQSALVGGTTVSATAVSAGNGGSGRYLFQNPTTVSATFEFSSPISAFRVVTANHADTGAGDFEEFQFTATSGASTPVTVTTSALRDVDGTFDYLTGVSLSATVSRLTIDYAFDNNNPTPGARGSYLTLLLNCSSLTAVPSSSTLSQYSPMSPVLTARNGFGGTITYAVVGGTLPAGVTLDPNTGVMSGTPTSADPVTVIISATGSDWGYATAAVSFTITASSPPPAASSPGALLPLIDTPATIPSTSVPPTTVPPTTVPPTTQAPSTTTPAAPAPVRETSGELPVVEPGTGAVIEDGIAVPVETFVDNGEALVLRGQDFELRLAGQCTTGCAITTDDTGRETIALERDGQARVGGYGFKPGTLVHVWIFSEPTYLGALLVDANGDFTGSFPLKGIDVGEHTLQANGISFDDQPRSANLGIVVSEAAVPAPQPGALPATGTSPTSLASLAMLLLSAAGLIGIARRRIGHRPTV